MHSQHILFLDTAMQPKAHLVLPPPPTKPKLHLILPPAEARVAAHVILLPPKVAPRQDVFAEAMLEDTSVHQRHSLLDWVVSVALHFAVLAALLVLPLYFTNHLDIQQFNLTFLAPPVVPSAAPPPAPMATSAPPRAVRNVPARAYTPGKLTAPSFIPQVISVSPVEQEPPAGVAGGLPGGVPGGIPGGEVGGVLGGVIGGVLKNLPAPPAPSAEGPKKPVQVGGNVKPPRLLYGPDPEYPVLAEMSRISGIVVIEAIIDEHGNVTGMRAISGPPLLIPPALTAVSKRKYEPTILDGDPTPIDLRVEVSFQILP